MENISAECQKIEKLSVGSYESSEECLDSSQRYSIFPIEEVEDLICELRSTLGVLANTLDNSHSVFESLKVLVKKICSEYSERVLPVQEIYLKNYQPLIDEISVNLVKSGPVDPIRKIFAAPKNGLFLSNEECKIFSALIIGAVRDSSSHYLKRQNDSLQEKIINLALVNNKLKSELKEKSEEIESLLLSLKDFDVESSTRKYLSETTKSELSIDKSKDCS